MTHLVNFKKWGAQAPPAPPCTWPLLEGYVQRRSRKEAKIENYLDVTSHLNYDSTPHCCLSGQYAEKAVKNKAKQRSPFQFGS